MKRMLRMASFACAALAFIALVLIPVAGPTGRIIGGIAVLIAATAAVVVAARVHRLAPFYLVGLAFVAGSVAIDNLWLDEHATIQIDRLRGGVDLALNLVMALVLVRVVRARRKRLTMRDGHDALTLLAAASLAVWTAIVHPLIDRGIADPLTALAISSHLPVSLLQVGLAAALITSGLERNRAAWLLAGAMIVHFAGDLIGALTRAEVLPDAGGALSSAAYVSAFLLAAAAILHPSSADALRPSVTPPIVRIRMRIIVLTVGLAVPVALIAAIPGTSVADHAVRTLGGVLLITLGALRLHQAMHASTKAESQLLDRSRRDELTKLPNRRQMLETAAEVLDRTWRAERRPAIMQINIDRFKNINDTLGHDLANDVLVAMAERLSTTARSFDGSVARVGGDEFVILDADTSSAQAVVRAEEVRTALGLPFDISGHTVFVTASIGLVVAPRNRTITPEELFRRGDIATHRAKANGRNCIAMFDDSMQISLTERMDIENALYGAIDRHELRLYHQPIVDVTSGTISGLEALIRWRRGDTTMRPDQFIPIAEETGLINEIGAWAMLEALNELRGWIDQGVLPPATTMSVNVSPRQIADPNFPDVVSEALARSGVPAHLLWLEVTESMMISEPELAKATLRRVRGMGVRIALDDFGTGYSSLSILQHFPIQRIKIDRAFVNGVAEHSNDRSLVRTIIAMGTSLGLDIVAEGVESIHQLGTLRDLGCSKAQGYLISHPVPADAMRSTMTALKDLSSLAFFTAPAAADDLADLDQSSVTGFRADQLLDN